MAEQLSLMARGQRLEMLAYLLDMARVEAEAVVSLQISVAQTPSSMPATPQRTDIQKHFEI